MKYCFVHAMDCEGKKLNELLTEEYNSSEKLSLVITRKGVVSINPKSVNHKIAYKNLGKNLVWDYMMVGERNDSFPVPVYSMNKYSDDVFTLKTMNTLYNAYNAAEILKSFDFDEIINVGVSGALEENLKIGDVIFSNKSYYKPVDSDTYKMIIVKKEDEVMNESFICPTVTVDYFCSSEKKPVLGKMTGAYAVDCESAIIASVGGSIYRMISDEISHDKEDFQKNLPKVMEEYDDFIERLISFFLSPQLS